MCVYKTCNIIKIIRPKVFAGPTQWTNTFGYTRAQLIQRVTGIPIILLSHNSATHPLQPWHTYAKEGSIVLPHSASCEDWPLSQVYSLWTALLPLPPGAHDSLTQENPWPHRRVLAVLHPLHLVRCYLFNDCLLYSFLPFFFATTDLLEVPLPFVYNYYCQSLVNIHSDFSSFLTEASEFSF